MLNEFSNKDRRVLPSFRSIKKTILLGETESLSINNRTFNKSNIAHYITDFNKYRTLSFAGDLISAAVVNNISNDPNVINAAEYILSKPNESTSAQIKTAGSILNIKSNGVRNEINGILEFIESNNQSVIHEKIKQLKSLTKQIFGNAFVYVELARLYSIIAQNDKALKSILIAKSLSPNNRYVLRSFARLNTHFNDIDTAHTALKKSNLISHDPWIIASEIAISSIKGKTSAHIKRGIEILNSKKYNSFSISELASSIGTIELIQGNRKKSKSHFNQALINPNENSLAQVEWANTRDKLFDSFNINDYNVKSNYEALAFDQLNKNEFRNALKNAEAWFLEMPFAKRPISLGHYISSIYLEDYESSINFCLAGLIGNPNNAMTINNISYSYAMLGDTDRAFEYLRKVEINNVQEIETKVCLIATHGLSLFRSGLYEEGRQKYSEAIAEAQKNKLESYTKLAIVHLINEEIRIKPESFSEYYEALQKIKDPSQGINLLIERIIDRNKR
ncbi:tetratricopeptide repeat protein [Chitinophaga sancti]|uniref:Tetratricopeptide repeat-containing protein n=1 Tax=Chitinophaga sancti TaxID=1004 RepID=A0A1K1SND9_9BACT|nr:hypothetical protein [Chitinophaga sancti]WQD60032.1 hypothetical protein U0033_19265 [Chitinophaga sancti]WQG87838.1 hypothetical protein SR876_23200 [Chitinophaga sancti]SFW85920.1 hypothetical protein SAMN05661012_05819 [Chitinophaga sancti]